MGLALGLATFIVVAVYIHGEWSFDRFHENADRIYRVTGHYTSAEGTRSFARTHPAAGPLLATQVPGVELTARLHRTSGVVRVGDRVWQEDEMAYAEPQFLAMFSFPLLYGHAGTALDDPDSVVLTRDAALTFFGREDVVGSALAIDGTLYRVTGVSTDVPSNSHLNFRVLISFRTHQAANPDVDLDNTWSRGVYYTFALLAASADPEETQRRIDAAVDRARGVSQSEGTRVDLALQPLLDIHLRSDLRQDWGPGGNRANLLIFGLIGLLVLLISCLNFVNLATAMSAVRSPEIGVRKALGASRGQLLRQFIGESVVISLLALALAVGVASLAIPYLGDLAGRAILPSVLLEPASVLGLVALAVLVGGISGIYPALVLSSFAPVEALAGSRGPSGSRLRSILITAQFSASVFLIGGTLVALSQLKHLRDADLGVDAEQVAVIPFRWDPEIQRRYPALRQALSVIPNVESVAASGDVPGRMSTSMSVWAEGMDRDASLGMNALILDEDFAETYGLEVVAGRDFSPLFPTDRESGFMINEAAASLLGWTPEEAVGKALRMNGPGTVVGVLRDFHYVGVQDSIEPIVMAIWPGWFGYISVRLGPGSIATSVDDIREAWIQVAGDVPFELLFLDEDFDRLYRAERRFGILFGILAGLAILIATMGLYGLAAFAAARRRKEIGVRKVLGAGVAGLAGLLLRGQLTLLLLSVVVATPLTWIVMSSWLERYATRIDLSLWPMLTAAAVTIPVALLAVLSQTVRAAMADPISSLKQD